MPLVNQKNDSDMGQSQKRGWRITQPISGRSFKAYSSLWTRSFSSYRDKCRSDDRIGLKNVRPWKLERVCFLHLHGLWFLLTSPPPPSQCHKVRSSFSCLRFVFLRRLPYRRKRFVSRSEPMVWLYTWDWTEEMAGWRVFRPHVDWIEGHAQFHYTCIQSMWGHKAIIS